VHYGNVYYAMVNVTWSADSVVETLTLNGATVTKGGTVLNHSGSGTMEIRLPVTATTFPTYSGQTKNVTVKAKAGNKSKDVTRSINIPPVNGATAATWDGPSDNAVITLKN